jgi:hypothetical protein
MRFSDLMGSGGEREPEHSDSPIDAAIAPYLDGRADTAPPASIAPIDTAVEPVEVVAASEPTALLAPDLPAQPGFEPAVASFDVTTPVEPAAARRAWQPDRPVAPAAVPVEVSAPMATAVAVADLTPFSDDLLPRKR